MDQGPTKATAAQAKGSVKEAIGKITGNPAVDTLGTAQTSAAPPRKTLGLAKARTAPDDGT